MKKSELKEIFEELKTLEKMGLVKQAGRKFNPKTKSYDVIWEATDKKDKQVVYDQTDEY